MTFAVSHHLKTTGHPQVTPDKAGFEQVDATQHDEGVQCQGLHRLNVWKDGSRVVVGPGKTRAMPETLQPVLRDLESVPSAV